MTTAPPGQQIDLVRDHVEHGIALVRLGPDGEPLVGGGPFAGQPWPLGMLDGPVGRLGDLSVRVVAPLVQIEIKQLSPVWNPLLPRREKDLDDVAAIRSRLTQSP